MVVGWVSPGLRVGVGESRIVLRCGLSGAGLVDC